MAKKPLTKELLDKFGPGDQFQVFFPETGGRIVAEVIKIELQPVSVSYQLTVFFKDAIEFSEAGPAPLLDMAYRGGSLLDDLFVSEEEDGYIQIPDVGAEQVLMFMKPTHRHFAPKVAGPTPNDAG